MHLEHIIEIALRQLASGSGLPSKCGRSRALFILGIQLHPADISAQCFRDGALSVLLSPWPPLLLQRPAQTHYSTAISSSHTSAVDIISRVMFTDTGGFVASGQIKNGDAAGRPIRCSSEWVNP